MPKITQKKVPSHLQPVFTQAGITFKKFASTAAFEKALVKFLATNHVMHLGTCVNNSQRVTPVMYRNNGMVFYVMTEGGGKLSNLKKNKKVSFSIADPYDSGVDLLGYKGIQGWGRARVYSMRHDPEKFAAALNNMNAHKSVRSIEVGNLPPEYHYRIIEIIPEKIKYLNPRGGVFHITWQKG
jgi:nitroimidazol reductase NimA-like FMN-containing flavoprotein (pyridoxamine 5'-phosphate oxidase superfamily)